MLSLNCNFSAARADIESNIDDVCKLLRSTGFTSGRRPPKYPEDYFRFVQLLSLYFAVKSFLQGCYIDTAILYVLVEVTTVVHTNYSLCMF